MLDCLAAILAAVTTGRQPRQNTSTRPSWRKRLRDFVMRRPGERLAVIWKETGASRATAKYHLLMLERNSEVVVSRRGHARYFPPTTRAADVLLLSILMRGRVAEVARRVAGSPGIAQKDLTQHLPMSRKVFRSYANLLVSHDLMEEVQDSHARRYLPKPRLAELLEQLPKPPGAVDAAGKGSP